MKRMYLLGAAETPDGLRSRGAADVVASRKLIGDVFLLSLRGSSSTRVALDTATTHPGHVAIFFVDVRSSSGERREGLARSGRSALVVATGGMQKTVELRGSWDILAVLMPRAATRSITGTVPRCVRTYSDRRVLERSLRSFVDDLQDADTPAPGVERFAVERLLVEMAGAILLDRFGPAPLVTEESLYQRAMALIKRRCGDVTLTPSGVARELHCSLRLLQTSFAKAGTGVATAIRRQRADLARSVLMDERFETLPIEEVSRRAGFRSSPTMRRALAREYGVTPASLRRAATLARSAPSVESTRVDDDGERADRQAAAVSWRRDPIQS